MGSKDSGNDAHGDGPHEVTRPAEKHAPLDKASRQIQRELDPHSRQELNNLNKAEQNPENRLSRKTGGRGNFGECAINDVIACGNNKSTEVQLKNGLPEKIHTPTQDWQRDAKNPRVWHVQEGEKKFDVQADVRFKDNELSAKIKYAHGREVTFKNGEPSEITHPNGEKWTADPTRSGTWEVIASNKDDPSNPHHTKIQDVKVNLADGDIKWQTNIFDQAPAILNEPQVLAQARDHSGSTRDVITQRIESAFDHAKALDNGAVLLDPSTNCSDATKKFWSEMCKEPNANYNCEFAALAFINPAFIHIADHTNAPSVTFGAEVRLALATCGWHKHPELTLDSAGHKSGEVLLITEKDGRPHAAIVGKVSPDGHILTIEQKPDTKNPPEITTVEQFKNRYEPKKGASIDFFRHDEPQRKSEKAEPENLNRAVEHARLIAPQIVAHSMHIPPRPHLDAAAERYPVVRGALLNRPHQPENDSNNSAHLQTQRVDNLPQLQTPNQHREFSGGNQMQPQRDATNMRNVINNEYTSMFNAFGDMRKARVDFRSTHGAPVSRGLGVSLPYGGFPQYIRQPN